MAELDRVGNSVNFDFMGFHRFCTKHSQATRKKRWNVCTMLVLLYIYSKILGVRQPVCPVIKNKVLMLIKVSVV